MKSAINNFVKIIFTLLFSISFSMAAGDDPCTATPLTTSTTCTYSAQDNNGATASAGITAPGCSSYSNNDVWFTIVVPASGNVQVDTQTGTITDGGIAFYTGATCSALTLLSCDDDSSPNGLMPLLAATGLTPGSTLYVRFWKYGGGSGTFSICATTFSSPLNDNPATATTLTCGATCTTVSSTFLGATQTLAGCTGNANDDVWFSFVATQSSVLITVNPGTSIDPVVELFSGTPGSLTSIVCDDASFPNGISGTGQYNGLTIGQTYYYRVYGFSSTLPNTTNSPFTTCVYNAPPPPINDNCAGSITVTSGVNCTSVSGTVYGATQSQVGCLGTANDDVWFSFVATWTSQLISVTPVAGFDPVVELFSGTCGSLTSISCNNNSYPSGISGNAMFSGLTVGQIYFYRVYQFGSLLPTATNASFTTCVTNAPTPPSNDECINSMNITVGSSCNPTTGLIYGATQSLASGCGTATLVYDVWFSFVATNPYQNITATLNNSSNVNLQVYLGTCNNLTSIYCGVLNPLTTSFSTLDNLIPGQTYYYRIYPSSSLYPANTLSFSTCVTSATPNNQDCLGAIPLCQNVYTTTTAYAGVGNFNNEINGALGCLSSGEKNDVWYTFNVITSGNLSFTISPTVTTNDYDWAVYNLTNANCSDINNNAALQVSCNFSPSSGPTGPNGLSGYQNNPVIPVTAGQTYMINVSQYSTLSNGYTLDFSASTATIFDNVAPVFQSVSSMSCGASGISATFSENVLCSTVSVADFTLVGPDGNHSVTNISGTGCSIGGTMENTYTVSFSPPLTVSGNYTFSLVAGAGSVSDLCGNVAAPQSFNFTISVPTVTAATLQNALCNGGNTGSIISTPSGGTTPYTYTWTSTNGQTASTQNVTNASAGTYTITLADATGCSATASTIVTEPTALPASASTNQNALCFGGNTGSISATAIGGTSPYTYSWTSTNGQTATTQNVTNASAGTYTITITDANNCTSTATTIVTEPTVIVPTASTLQNVLCNGGTTGSISATASGGTAPYSYSWTSTNGQTASTQSVMNASAGTYSVTVTDGNNCTSTATTVVTEPTVIVPTASALQNVLCNGGSTGSITATATGGTSPYTYSWTSTNGQTASTQNITNASAGTYTVTVTDANNCTSTATTLVTEPTVVSATATTVQNVLCNGGNTGNITTTPVGGTAPYTYSWTATNGQTASTQNITNASAGIYTVALSDANGCSTTASTTVTEPTIVSATLSIVQNVLCNGGNTGSISSTVSGGTAPYTYSWNTLLGSASSSTVSSLTAGNYTLGVADANGCQASPQSITVTEPTGLSISFATINPTCTTLGLISSTVTGGTGTYTYLWSPTNATTSSISNLAVGNYSLTVTDQNGCSKASSTQLTNTSSITATITPLTGQCLAGNQFSFSSNITDPAATYSWSFGDNSSLNTTATPTYTYAAAGNYIVGLTVSLGTCTDTDNTTINVYSSPVAQASANTPCEGKDLMLSGLPSGMANYAWSGPSSSTVQNPIIPNCTNALVGTYTLTVTDIHGCIGSTTTNVAMNGLPSASITGTNLQGCTPIKSDFVCTNQSFASYSWNYGDGTSGSTSAASHLYSTPGDYTVSLTVTDANGCNNVITQPNFVQAYGLPFAAFQISSTNGENISDPIVYFTDMSSKDVTSWNWNFGDNTSTNTASNTSQNPSHMYSNMGASYTVMLIVENEHGCIDTVKEEIKINEPLLYYVPNSFTPDGDKFNQVFAPVFTSGFDPYDYKMTIYNRWGELLFETNDTQVGWDGTYGGKIVQDGTYVWSIQFGLLADDSRKSENGILNLMK